MAGKDLKPVIGEFLFHPFFKRCGSNDVFIMREATGIESIFPDWIYRCKLDQDYYQPFDLNLPDALPRRADNARHYRLDPPLSESGLFEARLVGRQLTENSASIRQIFCAPQLKAIQTANEIAKFFKSCGGVCVERGFQTKYYEDDVLLSTEDLLKFNFKVKKDYKSPAAVSNLLEPALSETDELSEVAKRAIISFQAVLDEEKQSSMTGNTLFVVDCALMKVLVDYCIGTVSLENENCYISRASVSQLRKKAAQCFPPSSILSFSWVMDNTDPNQRQMGLNKETTSALFIALIVAALRRFVSRKTDCNRRKNTAMRQLENIPENNLLAKLGPPNICLPLEIESPPGGARLSLKENEDYSLIADEQQLKKEIQHLRASLRLVYRQLGAARRIGDEWRQFGRYAGRLARQAVADAEADCGRRVARLGAEMRQLRRLCLYLDAQRYGTLRSNFDYDGGTTLDENGNVADFFDDQLKELDNDDDGDAAADRHCVCVLSYIDSLEERILRMESEQQQDEEALGIDDDALACFSTDRLNEAHRSGACVITRSIKSSYRSSTTAEHSSSVTSYESNRNSSASTADSAFSSATTAVGEGEDGGIVNEEEAFKVESDAISTQSLSSSSRLASSSPPLLWDDDEHCHQLMGAHKSANVGRTTSRENDTQKGSVERSDSDDICDPRTRVVGRLVDSMSPAPFQKVQEQFDRSKADEDLSAESPSTSSSSWSSSALNDSDLPPKMPQLRISELIHTMSTCNIINSNGCSSTNNDEAITTAATKRRPIVGYPLVFEDEVEPADGVERRSIGRGYNASTVYRRMSACHHCQSEKLPAKNEAPFHYDYRSATLSPRPSYVHSDQWRPSARMTTASTNQVQHQQLRRRVPPTTNQSNFPSVQVPFKQFSVGLNRMSGGV